MKFANITRKFLRLLAKLHHAALNQDCKLADKASDRAFTRAANYLEVVRAAQRQLEYKQEQALDAAHASDFAWKKANDEVEIIKKVGL